MIGATITAINMAQKGFWAIMSPSTLSNSLPGPAPKKFNKNEYAKTKIKLRINNTKKLETVKGVTEGFTSGFFINANRSEEMELLESLIRLKVKYS